MCDFPEVMHVIKSQFFIKGEFLLCANQDNTPVFTAAYFGRKDLADFVKTLSNDQRTKEIIYKMLL